MAGNVREWVWNETTDGSNRYILGGAWTDPEHSFQDPEARSPFDRSEQNGFRVAQYLDSERLHDGLTGPIPPPARDYTNEQPVSDEVFRAYERLFTIDPEPLDPRVESSDSSAEGWTKEKVSFTATYGGERVPASVPTQKCSTALSNRCLFSRGRCDYRENDRGSRDRNVRFPDVERPGRSLPCI